MFAAKKAPTARMAQVTIRGAITLAVETPADLMAMSSLFSAIAPIVIIEESTVARGRERGSIVAAPQPRNSSIILSDRPLPTSSSM